MRASAIEGAGLYQLLVDSVRDYAIFALDATGHIVSWNAGAQRIKGYTTAEIVGRHFSTFYPAEDIAAGKPAWELEVAVAEGKFEEEGWRLRKDGSKFWANVVITPLFGEDGVLVGFAKVTRDLTERRAAQERAIADARRIAEAEVANRTKAEFLAAMSHELRTPLNAIGGYAELLDVGVAGPLSEQQHEYLARIRSSQQHLLGIITDLLNYSRIEAGQMSYSISVVPLQASIGTVVSLVTPQAVAKEIRLTITECKDTVVALADQTKAEQVILNLLSNAVKFTPPGGEICIGCGEIGDEVFVTVTDTGPGVPLEKQAAIFEPFVQVGRTFASAHEGTGLGLAISRDLARAMGGDVRVASDGEHGSEFTFTLPRG